jgi:hypothetical protein
MMELLHCEKLEFITKLAWALFALIFTKS